jgi:hypothetical protein
VKRAEPAFLTHEQIDEKVRDIAALVYPGAMVSRKADNIVVQSVNALLSHIVDRENRIAALEGALAAKPDPS